MAHVLEQHLVFQTVSGDLERECIEESCDDQEFHEVYDDLSISEPKYIKYLDCLNYINKSDRQTAKGKGTGWNNNIPVTRLNHNIRRLSA